MSVKEAEEAIELAIDNLEGGDEVGVFGIPELQEKIEVLARLAQGLEDENHDLRNQLNTARRSY